MDSQHIIYIFGRCLLLLHAIFSRSYVLVADASTDMSTTNIPPNFVPMIDGATGVKQVDQPGFLASPDAKGQICTLASLKAMVVIWPEGDASREVRIEMPDKDVTVSTVENCYAGNNPSLMKPLLVITWSSSFQLCFYFFKDEKNWNVNQVVFAFNTSEVPQMGIAKSELRMFGSEANAVTEVKAPLGISYRCFASKKFTLSPIESGAVVAGRINANSIKRINDIANLTLNNFQIQPFVDGQRTFEEEMICREDVLAKRHRRRRDSSVTIAVGSSLAVLSVVTVMCYAIFRYVKIKAVGYDTMQ